MGEFKEMKQLPSVWGLDVISDNAGERGSGRIDCSAVPRPILKSFDGAKGPLSGGGPHQYSPMEAEIDHRS